MVKKLLLTKIQLMMYLSKVFKPIIMGSLLIGSMVQYSCTDDNDAAPVEINLGELGNFTVNENVAEGFEIATIPATVTNSDSTPVYSIVNQTPSGALAIIGNKITVADPSVFDFETNAEVTGEIKAAIGEIVQTKAFKVGINDQREVGINLDDLVYNDVDENSPIDTEIGTLIPTLIDTETPPTYTILNQTPAGAIKIVGNRILVADDTTFDYETNTSITAEIKAEVEGVSTTTNITINITDVDESPTIIIDPITAVSIPENSVGLNETLAQVNWRTEYTEEVPVFTITSLSVPNAIKIPNFRRAINPKFVKRVPGSSGQFSIMVGDESAFDYETNTSITAVIEGTVAGVSTTVSVTINITDVDDIPLISVGTIPQVVNLRENNIGANYSIWAITWTGQNLTEKPTFTLINEQPTQAFQIEDLSAADEKSNGELRIRVKSLNAYDYEFSPIISATLNIEADGVIQGIPLRVELIDDPADNI